MKHSLTFLTLLLTTMVVAQSNFPNFLQGTWKMENKDSFEHWDLLNENSLKGFSYKMKMQVSINPEIDTTISNPNYDPQLAQKLGADDYGMKSYILAILKTGSNQTTDRAFISNCFRGHLDNINRLAKEGKLVVAGPLGKNDNSYRGIFILNATTIEDAELLIQTDPAINEGLLDVELYKWYGSAALPEYFESSDKIWKKNP